VVMAGDRAFDGSVRFINDIRGLDRRPQKAEATAPLESKLRYDTPESVPTARHRGGEVACSRDGVPFATPLLCRGTILRNRRYTTITRNPICL
jgi:hypothetical protein